MKMIPGMKEEYIKRHDQIWPEIAELIKKSGVSDYSIFLDEETNILFGVQKVEGNLSSQDLGFNEIQKKMVGLYGRYYGNQSRQFSDHYTFSRSFPPGIKKIRRK